MNLSTKICRYDKDSKTFSIKLSEVNLDLSILENVVFVYLTSEKTNQTLLMYRINSMIDNQYMFFGNSLYIEDTLVEPITLIIYDDREPK